VYFVPEDGGSRFLRNVGKNLQVYRVSFQKTAIVTVIIVETPNLSTIPTAGANIAAETHNERLISKETFISW
jgi:hypothetical protein